MDFFEILDLSSPNTREKYLLKTKCLVIFSLQATAVDRCETDETTPAVHSLKRSLGSKITEML